MSAHEQSFPIQLPATPIANVFGSSNMLPYRIFWTSYFYLAYTDRQLATPGKWLYMIGCGYMYAGSQWRQD